jgi:hypothetical protein
MNYKLGECNMAVDAALENGDMEKLKTLMTQCQPSLYAKQMAHINGHHKAAFYVDVYGKVRNDTDIKNVHYNYKTNKWRDVIPEEYRY